MKQHRPSPISRSNLSALKKITEPGSVSTDPSLFKSQGIVVTLSNDEVKLYHTPLACKERVGAPTVPDRVGPVRGSEPWPAARSSRALLLDPRRASNNLRQLGRRRRG
jgi:hypothetical protein